MRKILALSLVLCLALPAVAWAEEESAPRAVLVATGSVAAGDGVVSVEAPFGGTVAQIDVGEGDRVSQGDVLFAMDTVSVYAPVSRCAASSPSGAIAPRWWPRSMARCSTSSPIPW